MIRPLTADDVPLIPRLLASNSSNRERAERDARPVIESLFPPLFLNTPHAEPDIHGLASVGDDGELTGMIGTVLRQMQFRDRPIRAAISAELFVDPAHRSKMLGVKLFKQVIDGPQDLSFSDIANDSSRTLWQSLGGTVASWYGLNWLKVIRPGFLPFSVLSQSKLGKPLAWSGRPIAWLTDSLLRRAVGKFCKVNPTPKVQAEPLTPELFLQYFPQFGRADDLRPVYDREAIDWVWTRLDFMHRNGGASQQVLLRSNRGEPIGWYIYQLAATGIVRVSQIVAHPHTAGQVIDHLLNHAAERGAVAVAGRVVPRFVQAVSDRHCLILRRSTYLIVHSRDPEITDAFINGRAFLSLLEGEGPLQLWNNPEVAMQRLEQQQINQTARLEPPQNVLSG